MAKKGILLVEEVGYKPIIEKKKTVGENTDGKKDIQKEENRRK